MTDNQHTDAAQLAATLRERRERADERMRALSPGADATLELDERFMDKRALVQAEKRIAELELERERLLNIARYFLYGYWETVHIGIPYQRLTVTITQESLNNLRAQTLKGGDK